MDLPAGRIFLFCLLLISLTRATAAAESAVSPPVKIIFDTDMGSDCDDVGALALLHHFADEGKAEILACIFSSGKTPFGAGIVEAINVFYGRPDVPVGAAHDSTVGDPVDKMSAEKLARDQAAFGNRIVHNFDAEEMTRLNRRVLASQADGRVTYLTVGHTKGLYDLLRSQPDDISPLDGEALILAKVARWVALGALGAANPDAQFCKDWNFFFNGTAPFTQHLVEHFPAPIFYVDAGSDVMTGKSLKESPSGNIVRAAYRDWLWWYGKRTLDDQRPSWDLTAVYFAVLGTGDYLENIGQGSLEFDAAKGCRWTNRIADPPQFFIRQKQHVADQFADYLNKMISIEPSEQR